MSMQFEQGYGYPLLFNRFDFRDHRSNQTHSRFRIVDSTMLQHRLQYCKRLGQSFIETVPAPDWCFWPLAFVFESDRTTTVNAGLFTLAIVSVF